jgi:hypothetical protein
MIPGTAVALAPTEVVAVKLSIETGSDPWVAGVRLMATGPFTNPVGTGKTTRWSVQAATVAGRPSIVIRPAAAPNPAPRTATSVPSPPLVGVTDAMLATVAEMSAAGPKFPTGTTERSVP